MVFFRFYVTANSLIFSKLSLPQSETIRKFNEWLDLDKKGQLEHFDEDLLSNYYQQTYDREYYWDWVLLKHYRDLAKEIRGNYQIAMENSISESPLEEIPSDNTASNEERDHMIYKLSSNINMSWNEIARVVNNEFDGEQLDYKSAAKAATRYAKKHGLVIKKRKPGRKPNR